MRDEHAPPPLSTLTEEERAVALARYRLIQPCLEQGVPLAQVAKHHGLVRRTVQRGVARYRTHGLAGLTRRGRADRGHSRHLRPELKDVIEGLALRTPAPPLPSCIVKSQTLPPGTAGRFLAISVSIK
jgi:putative transposase